MPAQNTDNNKGVLEQTRDYIQSAVGTTQDKAVEAKDAAGQKLQQGVDTAQGWLGGAKDTANQKKGEYGQKLEDTKQSLGQEAENKKNQAQDFAQKNTN